MKKTMLVAGLFFCGITPLWAQKYEWLKKGAYDAAIPTPESVLGYEIGTYLTAPAEPARIAGEPPPIGWVNFGTDGNETSAFECSMQLAYQLVAGTDPLTRKLLDNVVVIINPRLTPDSHQWLATR